MFTTIYVVSTIIIALTDPSLFDVYAQVVNEALNTDLSTTAMWVALGAVSLIFP